MDDKLVQLIKELRFAMMDLEEARYEQRGHTARGFGVSIADEIQKAENEVNRISAEIAKYNGNAIMSNPLSLDEYQTRAKATDLYPPDVRLVALLMGLANEAGEALGHYKKHLRGDETYQDENALKTALIKEIGDTLWYLSGIASELGVPLSEVAQANLDKLASRYERGVIKKSGDDR